MPKKKPGAASAVTKQTAHRKGDLKAAKGKLARKVKRDRARDKETKPVKRDTRAGGQQTDKKRSKEKEKKRELEAAEERRKSKDKKKRKEREKRKAAEAHKRQEAAEEENDELKRELKRRGHESEIVQSKSGMRRGKTKILLLNREALRPGCLYLDFTRLLTTTPVSDMRNAPIRSDQGACLKCRM